MARELDSKTRVGLRAIWAKGETAHEVQSNMKRGSSVGDDSEHTQNLCKLISSGQKPVHWAPNVKRDNKNPSKNATHHHFLEVEFEGVVKVVKKSHRAPTEGNAADSRTDAVDCLRGAKWRQIELVKLQLGYLRSE